MFEEFLAKKLAEAAVVWAEQANALNEANFIQAAQNWAKNKAKGANVGHPPEAPKVVMFKVVNGNIVPETTAIPVSNVKPESFLPTFGTDISAIGGPVGGPIPNESNKFYVASGVSGLKPGDFYRHSNGDIYIYRQENPFYGYWFKV